MHKTMIWEEATNSFRHTSALTFGKIQIGEGASLWPYSVIRSELHEVQIGKFTNIQDHVMIHIGKEYPTIIGDYCSITHRSVIHGASIGNNCLVGIGAIIMDGCEIGDHCIVAGGSFLRAGSQYAPYSIIAGNPGRVVRTNQHPEDNLQNALVYHLNAKAYAQNEHRIWSDPDMPEQLRIEFQKHHGILK